MTKQSLSEKLGQSVFAEKLRLALKEAELKKEIDMIFTMTDFEMKLVVESIKKTLVEKSMENNRHNTSLKRLQIKIVRMIERQARYV